jgi:LysM repeat protein
MKKFVYIDQNKVLFTFLFLVKFCFTSFASDTLFVFINNENKLYLKHKVLPKHNLFRISNYYNQPKETIKQFNHLKSDTLKLSSTINLPLDKSNFIVTNALINTQKFKLVPIYFQVKKEYLFTVATMFQITLPYLKQLNNITLASNGFIINKALQIGWLCAGIEIKPPQNKPTDTISTIGALLSKNISTSASSKTNSISIGVNNKDTLNLKDKLPSNLLFENSYNKNIDEIEMEEVGTGICFFSDSTNQRQNGYYALHNSLPVGTYIKLVNNLNNNYVFAKVLGKIPEIYGNKKCIVKISPYCANALDIRDERFLLHIFYHLK